MPENKPSVLVVDDELSIREAFSLILGREFKVLTAASGEAALKKTIDEKIDLVYLDIRMPGMNGIETLKKIKDLDSDIPVIMVTAVNDVKNASEAIKLGARDYIVKPFDADEILRLSQLLTLKKATRDEVKTVRSKFIEFTSPELIGQSKAIKELEKAIAKVSQKDSPMLISGPNGTEKELVARVIHSRSKKISGSFKVYDIPARYSDDEIRKGLFGWEKGGFVAEFRKSKGAFEKASGGTLLLNNVEFLDLELQAELSNALTKKQYLRTGSMSPIQLDMRLICATAVDLKELAAKDMFSKELLALIGETSIDIPGLSSRAADIPVLIEHYMEKFSRIFNKETAISAEAMDILVSYPWPGNTIELKDMVGQLVLSSGHSKEIMPEDLPVDILLHSGADTSQHISFENIKRGFEKRYVSRVMKKVDQDKIKAASILGIGSKAFDSKLESLDIK